MGLIINDIMSNIMGNLKILENLVNTHYIISIIVLFILILGLIILALYFLYIAMIKNECYLIPVLPVGGIIAFFVVLFCGVVQSCNNDIEKSYLEYKERQPVYTNETITDTSRVETNIKVETINKGVVHTATFKVTDSNLSEADVGVITSGIDNILKNLNKQKD